VLRPDAAALSIRRDRSYWHISRASNPAVRVPLFEAAHVFMTRVATWSKLKAWAIAVAKRRGAKRAKVTLARKIGVVLHRMWIDGTDFRSTDINERADRMTATA
jgi:hypothetical protein